MTTTPDERARRYGLTPGQIQELRDLCEDRCWICGRLETGRALAIDHDHQTGQVRGLLCTRCNVVIGWMNDDPQLIRAAADYVDHSRDQYRDYCRSCRYVGREGTHRPTAVVESNDRATRFAYRCDHGHEWTCSWATRGLFSITPPAWKEG